VFALVDLLGLRFIRCLRDAGDLLVYRRSGPTGPRVDALDREPRQLGHILGLVGRCQRELQTQHVRQREHGRPAAIAAQRPPISIDAKKKELAGEYANGGREWAAKGRAGRGQRAYFPDKTPGKAIPYGIYATTLQITPDRGGGNRNCVRSWKTEL
jgi:hypothetical protein